MFNFKTEKNKKGVSSTNFARLITDSLFIHHNISKLDFIGGVMLSKSALNGVVYVSNIQPSLSEIDNVETIVGRIDLVDMIHLYTNNEKVDVYQNQYVGHTVTDAYIEINFKNGKSSRLNF